jgi:hypothetical protein
MSNPYLNYRTFDELLADVAVDLPTFHMEGMLDPGQLIKIAVNVNYDLGLRINQEKENIIQIDRKKAKLPDDFHVLNFATICGSYRVEEPILHGTHNEDVIVPFLSPDSDDGSFDRCGDPCRNHNPNNVRPCLTRCGQQMYVKQTFKHETRFYEISLPLRIEQNKRVARQHFRDYCEFTAKIRNGYLLTDLEHGNIYISYLGNMEDDDGNLMVPDHPGLNDYYEYALKERVLENMALDGENVGQKLQLIEPKLRAARNKALNVVNTPDFADMKAVWEMNRKAMLHRYYNIFI